MTNKRLVLPPREMSGLDSGTTQLIESGREATGGATAVFRVLAYNPEALRDFMRFSGHLLNGSVWERRTLEIAILRTARRTACDYEWRHHDRIARDFGLTGAEIDEINEQATGQLSSTDLLVVQAVDDLTSDRRIGDETWRRLMECFTPRQLLDLLLLVGAYDLLAMIINTAGIEFEEDAS